MKKILAFVLVLAMAVSFVPASFAVNEPLTAQTVKDQLADKEFDNALTEKVNSRSQVKSSNTTVSTDFSGLSEKYQSVPNPIAEETRMGYNDLPGYLYSVLEPEDTFSGWLLNYGEAYDIADDLGDTPVYGGWAIPVWNEGASASDHVFNKGENIFVNFEIYKSYSQSTGFDEFDTAKLITVYVFAGGADDEYIYPQASYTAYNYLSFNFDVPDDNMIFSFLIVVWDTSEEFVGYYMNSTYEYSYNTMPVASNATAKVGDTLSVNLGTSASTMILEDNLYLIYAKAYAIEMKKDEKLVLTLDSNAGIGGTIMFLDENMDIIGTSKIYEGWVDEYGYDSYSLPIWAPIDGTYYIVVGGFWIFDEGLMSLHISEFEGSDWGDLGLFEDTTDISLSSFGTTEVEEDYYQYTYSGNYGYLYLIWPGTYNITGSKDDLVIVAVNGATVNLENASFYAFEMANIYSYFPTVINCIGNNNSIGYSGMNETTIWNNQYLEYASAYNPGLYLTGDSLTVNGQLGIYLSDSPLHIGTKNLTVNGVHVNDSYYDWGLVVLGMRAPQITLGDNPVFNSTNKVVTVNQGEDFYFHFAYAVAKDAVTGDDYTEISASFTLTTDGFGETQPDDYLRGDANCDGNINAGDASYILQHMVSLVELTEQGFKNADANLDSSVNAGDASYILQALVGLVDAWW